MSEAVPPHAWFGVSAVYHYLGPAFAVLLFWRKIATAAGVPAHVWNRDSCAGGVTEGSDAGADIEHLRHHANHANIRTTGRYSRKTIDKTRAVAQLRVKHRSGQ